MNNYESYGDVIDYWERQVMCNNLDGFEEMELDFDHRVYDGELDCSDNDYGLARTDVDGFETGYDYEYMKKVYHVVYKEPDFKTIDGAFLCNSCIVKRIQKGYEIISREKSEIECIECEDCIEWILKEYKDFSKEGAYAN